ncbi:hypothetical protein EAH89_03885 [Roseomonas nepalensis]|uniref:Uncharacterized protein n=1 Tax=Muricoccus nepalensis TaxID=1854500 RepID=A0A502GF40_9PROT|nr:hypothetical protein [Roseomonas nepalensis]TPG60515.1 hypothetical protein EAH89_03885 [Roseomonas nepalensis]
MRPLAPRSRFLLTLLGALLALPGCEAVVPLAAVNGVSLMVTGRAVPDLVVSGLTGRDCSIAYLDARERYCRPDLEVVEQPRCTRSLGAVDCWVGPVPGNPPPRSVGDARPAAPAEPWPERVL